MTVLYKNVTEVHRSNKFVEGRYAFDFSCRLAVGISTDISCYSIREWWPHCSLKRIQKHPGSKHPFSHIKAFGDKNVQVNSKVKFAFCSRLEASYNSKQDFVHLFSLSFCMFFFLEAGQFQ